MSANYVQAQPDSIRSHAVAFIARMQHPLRKPTSKAPSAEAQAAAEIKERLTQYSSRCGSCCYLLDLTLAQSTQISGLARDVVDVCMKGVCEHRGSCIKLKLLQPAVKTRKPCADVSKARDTAGALIQVSLHRWDVQATIKGTTDVAAPLQAAKGLVALMALLHQQRGTCRRSEVRYACNSSLTTRILCGLTPGTYDIFRVGRKQYASDDASAE